MNAKRFWRLYTLEEGLSIKPRTPRNVSSDFDTPGFGKQWKWVPGASTVPNTWDQFQELR